ncbi:hypothetical protein AAFF_G00393680 [Aldrovandia affinis]|uniref:TNFR-Cys domain-containing protein n=1 Tax=Aldrovandia affinis TaxID=143900 RepID=A0AAD7SDL5_9TELE|nr:hypothetical protein AAFF_G00393680 [Aldrovandia affinis]
MTQLRVTFIFGSLYNTYPVRLYTIKTDIGNEMRKIIACVLHLVVVLLNNCHQLTAETYQREDDLTGDSVTCEKCAPGTYLVSHCTKDRRTVCAACPHLHYTQVWNYVERCEYCNAFCTEDQYEKVKCHPKGNRVCECKTGYYQNEDFCVKHSACPPGEGVSQNGTADTDVECMQCPDGSYSSEHSSTKACQKYSECVDGEREIPGDKMQDSFCTACKNAGTLEDQIVCDRAVLEFVVQYVLPPRKHRRLENTVKRATKDNSDLRHQLIILQKSRGDQLFVNVMLEILQSARLPRLQRKVEKWFLKMQTN